MSKKILSMLLVLCMMSFSSNKIDGVVGNTIAFQASSGDLNVDTSQNVNLQLSIPTDNMKAYEVVVTLDSSQTLDNIQCEGVQLNETNTTGTSATNHVIGILTKISANKFKVAFAKTMDFSFGHTAVLTIVRKAALANNATQGKATITVSEFNMLNNLGDNILVSNTLPIIQEQNVVKPVELPPAPPGNGGFVPFFPFFGDETIADDAAPLALAGVDEIVATEKGGIFQLKNTLLGITLLEKQIAKETKIQFRLVDLNKETLKDISLYGFDHTTNGVGEKLSIIGKPLVITASNEFSAELKATIPVTLETGVYAEGLGLYCFNTSTKMWDYLGGKYQASQNSIEAMITKTGTYAVMAYQKTFKDTSNSWAESYIEKLSSNRIISGNQKDEFLPKNNITRSEIVKMLTVLAGLEPNASATPFKDVKVTDWFSPYIKAAYDAKIVSGKSGDTFEPNANVSRQELVVMVMNVYAYKTKTNYQSIYSGNKLAFTDLSQIQTWARAAVEGAVSMKFVSGKGNNQFVPSGLATREEAAKVMALLFDALKTK